MKKLLLAIILCAGFVASVFGQSNPPLRIKEADGNPNVSGVTQIVVTNGSITQVSGKTVYLTTGGGGGGGSPGGSNTQLQYNNVGSFGGITGATTDGTAVTLTSPILVTPNIGTATGTSLTITGAFRTSTANQRIYFGIGSNSFRWSDGVGPYFIDNTATGGLVFNMQSLSSDRTFTWPNASGTVTTIAGTQTLTNKTVTDSTNVLGGVTMTLGSDATGDIYYRNSGGVLTRLGIGSSNQVLTVSGGLPSWAAAAGGGGITIGTTTITSGTNTRVLYNNAGVVGEYAVTGTGNAVLSASPTLTGIVPVTSTVTTGTGTSSGFSVAADSLTTGAGANFASSSVTSGSVVNIASTSTAAASSTLKGLNIAISGANGTTAQTVTGAAISVTNTNATSGTNTALSLTASGATTDNIAISTTAGRIVQTSASATAFESGPNGGTNPVFRIVNSTASQADGISITGLASGSGTTIAAIGSGSNAPITIQPKGTGKIILDVLGNNLDIKSTLGTTSIASDSGNTYLTVPGGVLNVQGNSNFMQLGNKLIKFYNAGFNAAIGSDTSGLIEINSGTLGQWRDLKVRQHYVDQTITAGGTTGNQTINKSAGTVNFAAAATAITVTNSLASTSSTIYAIARTNDSTCSVKNVVPASGSFTINMTAACTAETSVGFLVVNF